MDLNVRDWLVIIGALLAVAVLLDGFRRMRNERRDTIRLSSKKRRDDEDELINPELPGSARVVAVREAPSPSLHTRHARAPLAQSEPEDGVDDTAASAQHESADDVLFSDPAEEYGRRPVDDYARTEIVEPEAPRRMAADSDDAMAEAEESRSAPAKPDWAREPREQKPREQKPREQKASTLGDELFVIKVMAEADKPYMGQDLLQVLLACDLRYGRMNVFHRYENADGTGAEQFSVANLVEPGSFELDAIDDFSTPGVVFFMTLPGPEQSMQAFEAMLETARCLVKNLGGTMRDQSHSVATKQTFEHYRQRIRDFERRQLTLM